MIWVLSQRFRDRGTFTIIFPLFSPDPGRRRVNPRDVDGNIIIIYIVPTLIAYRRGIRQRGNKGRCALAEEDVGELYTRHACIAFRVHAKRLDAVRNVVKRSSYIIHIFFIFFHVQRRRVLVCDTKLLLWLFITNYCRTARRPERVAFTNTRVFVHFSTVARVCDRK